MADERQAELYQTQISLTEWLENIKHKDVATIRKEDNDKRERLKALKQIVGLPFDEPVKFEATDLRDKTPEWAKYAKEHAEELCALRLIPKNHNLPKLRLRGETVAGVYKWFLEQDINADDYRAEYIPHSDKYLWSTIFIINKHGIQGEIIQGPHYQLTQGFFDAGKPITFRYDFKQWHLSQADKQAQSHLKTITKYLHVKDMLKQKQIKKLLGGEFSNDYLLGYFETVYSQEFGLWFVDYSQSLGKMYGDFEIKEPSKHKSLVKGLVGSPGKAKGPVKIVDPDKIKADFPDGGVLVCAVTTPNYVPLMQKASAIITDQGGILSHAAIVARELKKPCIVGTGNATKVLKNGQIVSVNADAGTVNLL
jgi:phosphoenolpyruvate synthase/pyruvate phosphate dikinase